MVAVDLPLLTTEFLKYLNSRVLVSDRQIVACKIGSAFPLCMGFHRRLLPQLHERLRRDDLSIYKVVENSAAEIMSEAALHDAGFNSAIFRNLNTRQDYEDALNSKNL